MSAQRKNGAIKSPSVWHIRWQGKFLLLLAGLIIGGLLFQMIAMAIPQQVFLSSLCSQVSTALIISGVYTGISELLLKQDFIKTNKDNFEGLENLIQAGFEQLSNIDDSNFKSLTKSNNDNLDKLVSLLHLAKEGEKLGLETIIPPAEYCDESQWILKSQELKILLADGRNWLSHQNDRLRERFADSDKKTTIILLHPESAMLAIHANKVGSKVDSLQHKIAETIAELNQLKTQNTQLEIKGHHLYSGYSLLLSDTHAIMSPYFCSKKKRKPPTFVFIDKGGDCYYQRLKQDLECLESEAEDIANYQKKS